MLLLLQGCPKLGVQLDLLGYGHPRVVAVKRGYLPGVRLGYRHNRDLHRIHLLVLWVRGRNTGKMLHMRNLMRLSQRPGLHPRHLLRENRLLNAREHLPMGVHLVLERDPRDPPNIPIAAAAEVDPNANSIPTIPNIYVISAAVINAATAATAAEGCWAARSADTNSAWSLTSRSCDWNTARAGAHWIERSHDPCRSRGNSICR